MINRYEGKKDDGIGNDLLKGAAAGGLLALAIGGVICLVKSTQSADKVNELSCTKATKYAEMCGPQNKIEESLYEELSNISKAMTRMCENGDTNSPGYEKLEAREKEVEKRLKDYIEVCTDRLQNMRQL